MPHLSQFRLLTAHAALYHLSSTMAGGFVGAYLLKLGLGLPVALATYAAILSLRFGMRLLAVEVVRRVGLNGALRLGACMTALGFLPLLKAQDPVFLAVWVVNAAMAEALYWPTYHASSAASGQGPLGRQVAERTMIAALVSVLGPIVGGSLLATFGEGAGFGIAILVRLLSTWPVGHMAPVDAGPIPSARESLRGDRRSMAIFAADGWMAAGLGYAWPMVLFASMGGSYQAFGAANAAAGLVGAAASLWCGRSVDRGQRDRWLLVVCVALVAAFVLRAVSGWSPLAANLANLAGAAIAGFYGPVVMSTVYERTRQSGAAYRCSLASEAGWDLGAVLGLLTAAAVAWAAPVPSCALLPATLGVLVLYACVRGQGRPAAG